MANEKTTRTPDTDARRDFETGTVNPGPGMAPPHWADDIPAGSMTGADDAKGQANAGTGRTAGEPTKATDGGCCGCG